MNCFPFKNVLSRVLVLGFWGTRVFAQVELATDGPKPLSPEESARAFRLVDGFRIELVASEPLIQAPSGVCWDAEGRLYVSELHGYNLEGQYDIEALNKTGKLDRVVRRIQANETAKAAAEAGTYGVIKRLKDTNGDGRMDQARVFAKDLPPCYGMVAARGGVIVASAPHILFLADTNGDGTANVREVLYTGFGAGILERRINAPQWGIDNWIYFGGGGSGGDITGPYLDRVVSLGRTDFRIKADGSAIEAIAGHTGTFGHTFSGAGDRITISTGTPGYQVIPLPWRYLMRNPDLSIPSLERNAAAYQATYPVAKPHPWRTRRFEDPGFSKYYTDHYGEAESIPSGYFTSACAPLIYRDRAFPEHYWGGNFTCEPAQNLIHHSVAHWDGPELRLVRGGAQASREAVRDWAEREREKIDPELPLASEWQQLGPFRGPDKNSLYEKDLGPENEPSLAVEVNGMRWMKKPHFEDGELIDLGLPENAAVYLYRTLTSKEGTTVYASLGSNDSIKCWLNGSLILKNNVNRGVAADQETATLKLNKGSNSFLMKIVNGTNASGFYFKLLPSLVPANVRAVVRQASSEWNEGQYALVEQHVQALLAHVSEREFLASTDSWFHPMNLSHGPDGAIYITDYYREIIEDYSAIPRYLQQQYGLTNGMHHGRIWRLSHQSGAEVPAARMSELSNGQLADELGNQRAWRRETARRLLIERGASEFRSTIEQPLRRESAMEAAINALYTLDGLKVLGGDAIGSALAHPHWAVRRHALIIGDRYPEGSGVKKALSRWLEDIRHYEGEARLLLQMALSLGEFQSEFALDRLADVADRLSGIRWMDLAVVSSSAGREDALLGRLLNKQPDGSPLVERLVETLATRRDVEQITRAMGWVERHASGSAHDLYQRMLEGALVPDSALARVELPAPELPTEDDLRAIEARFPSFIASLTESSSVKRGKVLFEEHCSSCHQARGMGHSAGPNLDSEFQRAPETILRDILFPNESITEGFETVRLEMRRGVDAIGVLASESPTSVTLKLPGGQVMTFLRKNIARMHSHAVSLMPAQFGALLEPSEVAAIVSFLRTNVEGK